MCDYYLGQVLDRMDQYDLWKDTMLIVNTDHGFLLTEHNWWGKVREPIYDELAHTPFFLWDPRSGVRNEHRGALCQTIDIAPTLLDFFNVPIPQDMAGQGPAGYRGIRPAGTGICALRHARLPCQRHGRPVCLHAHAGAGASGRPV